MNGKKPSLEKILELEKAFLGAFNRRINSSWIDPAKSRPYFEDMNRVFFRDNSPVGLYSACIVPSDLLGKVVVIMPQENLIEQLNKLGVQTFAKKCRFARILMAIADIKPLKTLESNQQTKLSDFEGFKDITDMLARNTEKTKELYGTEHNHES